MGLDNERRRDLIWTGFVGLSIIVPLVVFGIDVYFYIMSTAVHKDLSTQQERCTLELNRQQTLNITYMESRNKNQHNGQYRYNLNVGINNFEKNKQSANSQNTFSLDNKLYEGFSSQQELDKYKQLEEHLSYEDVKVVEGYKFSLGQRFRPCLLLSLRVILASCFT